MATLRTRWLLLLVTLPSCFSSTGPPAPSNLECYRPCDSVGCSVIRCVWNPNSTIYSLHWEPVNTDEEHVTGGNSSDGLIHRENFRSHELLRVWVQAENQNGSIKYQELLIDPEAIKKPPPPLPPTFLSNHQGSLEVTWKSPCDELQLSVGTCELRFRTEYDEGWPTFEDGLHGNYEVMDPQPCTVYEFQVRCECSQCLMSDWSQTYRIRSAEAAPVGQVDIWLDCVTPSSSSDCFLTWKNLSISEVRGFILGYEVSVSYINGTVKHINVSSVSSSSLWAYDETNWRLTSPLRNVSSVNVSAYNSVGTTSASRLVLSEQGKPVNDQTVDLTMTEESLTASWELPSPSPHNVKQYVVQYKECSPGKGFGWIKVDSNQTRVSFKGTFKKYTSYQVSVFEVSNLNEIHQISTAVGYSAQGVPSTVPSFKVSFITATDVTLSWEPVSCSKRNGVILYYQIGVVGTQKVYNVSVAPDHGNMTYKLPDLSPDQEYTVWIRAVTAAGPGPIVSTTLEINREEGFGYLILVLLSCGFLVIIIFIVVVVCVFRGPNKACPVVQSLYVKVPDPSNSHIFKHMRHQISEPLAWICIPLSEPNPKISLLEIVEVKSKALDPDGLNESVMENDFTQTICRDDQSEDAVLDENDRTDLRCGREEYSRMIDSDEERSEEWNSSEEEPFPSGYEQHFMPNPLEIM